MEELTQDDAQLARTMLMSAAQLAESMARVQAQRAWMTQSRSSAQAAQAQQQIAAERDAARMIFRPLTDDRYWRDAPQLDRVMQAYMTAASWAEHDSEARAAAQLIKQHAEERWRSQSSAARRASEWEVTQQHQNVGRSSPVLNSRAEQKRSQRQVRSGDASTEATEAAVDARLAKRQASPGFAHTSAPSRSGCQSHLPQTADRSRQIATPAKSFRQLRARGPS